jgi:hypothetical protein
MDDGEEWRVRYHLPPLLMRNVLSRLTTKDGAFMEQSGRNRLHSASPRRQRSSSRGACGVAVIGNVVCERCNSQRRVRTRCEHESVDPRPLAGHVAASEPVGCGAFVATVTRSVPALPALGSGMVRRGSIDFAAPTLSLAHRLAHEQENPCKSQVLHGLENRFGPLGPTRVQIPPPPLNEAGLESRPAAV